MIRLKQLKVTLFWNKSKRKQAKKHTTNKKLNKLKLVYKVTKYITWYVAYNINRPVKSHSRAREKIFEFFFKMVHYGVLYISGRRRGPQTSRGLG